MSRIVWAGVLAVMIGLWAGAGRATAQPPAPPRLGSAPPPPGYSPYLNLVRGGVPGANYYGLVRPQQYFQGALQNLQTQQQLLAQTNPPGQPEGAELPGTGVPVGFMTHHTYFMNLGGTGMSMGMAPARTGTAQLGTGVQNPNVPAPRTR